MKQDWKVENFVPRRKKKNYDSVMVVATPKVSGAWRLWLLLVVFILILGGSVYLLFFSPYFRVKNVIVQGGTEEVQQKIKEMVSWETDYMILFQTNNFENSIQKRWEDLADAQVKLEWPDRIRIILIPEIPKMIWNSSSKLYLINKSGMVLSNISEEERMSKYNDLPVVGDLSGIPVEKGKKILSKDFVLFVESVRDNIKNSIGKDIEAFEIKETTFSLNVRMRDGYTVYFDTLRDPVSQVEKLNTFLKKGGVMVNEYMDLRVPGKVYYK